MNTFLQITAIVLATFSALMSILVIIPLRPPLASPATWAVKIFASALAPFFAIAGALSIILAIIAGPLWAILPGGYSTLIFLLYLYRVNASMKASAGFAKAFGPGWENQITAGQKIHFLPTPMALRLPKVPESNLILDIPFSKIPGTNRRLLCDLWQPPKKVKPSGLAFIYFHGSAWVFWDKDVGTRTFFQHLVAQGHVIMDVAYRLFPETDMTGMVQDVYRAIAWMKTNASTFGVNPDSIVIGGGSAGGHLSLLAAYSNDPKFIPEELNGTDLKVQAVISAYGPTDLEPMYYHNGQEVLSREPLRKAKEMPGWVRKMMGINFERLNLDKQPAMLPDILGCQPKDCPGVYASFSPITYVHKGCPPSLLIQGEHDLITPVNSVRHLYKRLTEAGVPAVLYILPQTDHAFDLVLPRISPAAHTVFYIVERFLALQVKGLNQLIQQKIPMREAEKKAAHLHATNE